MKRFILITAVIAAVCLLFYFLGSYLEVARFEEALAELQAASPSEDITKQKELLETNHAGRLKAIQTLCVAFFGGYLLIRVLLYVGIELMMRTFKATGANTKKGGR